MMTNIATTLQESFAQPVVERAMPTLWRDQAAVLDGLSNPQLRLFWAVELNLVERRRCWFGRGWKLRRREV